MRTVTGASHRASGNGAITSPFHAECACRAVPEQILANFRAMNDKMVTPLYEREDGSAPGPFYVIKDQCITCSLPTETAPENIRYHERTCTSCPTSPTQHCVVTRQPETPEELDCMIEVVAGSCVAAYRYCGTDSEILRRLVEAGCGEQCDALVERKPDDVG